MTHSAALVWITPNAEQIITDCARVSSPQNQGKDGARLLRYLVEHKHWSPFEMASACFEINTSRTIARQILRHRSFSFQEFSQRYAVVGSAECAPVLQPARMAGATNRQGSLPCQDPELASAWEATQLMFYDEAMRLYKHWLSKGIAPEVARVLLPEGLTPSRMYMTGTVRSWIHYCGLRQGDDTQTEHRFIAEQIADILALELPNIREIFQ